MQQAQAAITEAALGIWPGCSVGSFGSQANATALPGADIDITILGVRDMDGAAGIKRCAAHLPWTSTPAHPSLCTYIAPVVAWYLAPVVAWHSVAEARNRLQCCTPG